MLKVIILKSPKSGQDREKTIVLHNWGSEQSKLIVKCYWFQFWPHLVAFRADTNASDIVKMARDMKRPKNALKIVENQAVFLAFTANEDMGGIHESGKIIQVRNY